MVSVAFLVFALNFVLIYVFFLARKSYFLSAIFIFINGVLVSEVLESYISWMTIWSCSIIAIYFLIKSLLIAMEGMKSL